MAETKRVTMNCICIVVYFIKMFLRMVFKNKNQTCPWPLFLFFLFFVELFCQMIRKSMSFACYHNCMTIEKSYISFVFFVFFFVLLEKSFRIWNFICEIPLY